MQLISKPCNRLYQGKLTHHHNCCVRMRLLACWICLVAGGPLDQDQAASPFIIVAGSSEARARRVQQEQEERIHIVTPAASLPGRLTTTSTSTPPPVAITDTSHWQRLSNFSLAPNLPVTKYRYGTLQGSLGPSGE